MPAAGTDGDKQEIVFSSQAQTSAVMRFPEKCGLTVNLTEFEVALVNIQRFDLALESRRWNSELGCST